MTEKQKLERSPERKPFGALFGSTKRLPLNKNGMLAQYDTFNEADRSRKILGDQRALRKKWVSVSSLCDMAHGQVMRIFAPCVYLVLYVVYDFIIAKSIKAGGESFSPAFASLYVEMGKAFLSLVAYLSFSSESWPSISKLGYYITALSLPAACYAGITVVSLSKLGNVGLIKFDIWHQATIGFSIVLWFVVFRRKCGLQQSIALMFLIVGCSVNTMQESGIFAVKATGLWVLACSILSAIGCVSNEYFYKSDKAADINLQNVVLYGMTSLCNFFFITSTRSEQLMSVSRFPHGFHGEGWLLIIIQVGSGLAVAQMLKHTSVITKCYTMALGMSFEILLAQRLSGPGELSSFMSTSFAAFLILMSTVLYYAARMPEPLRVQSMEKDACSQALAKFRQTPFNWQIANSKASLPAQFNV